MLHLIRNTFRLASRRDWDAMAKDLRPVYTAINEADAKERLADFDAKWGESYPAIKGLWDNAWSEFVPFLDYSPEIRRVIYSTNAIESLNTRFRRASIQTASQEQVTPDQLHQSPDTPSIGCWTGS